MAAKDTGLSGLADRYATALFALADERDLLDQVATDLGRIQTLVGSSADLRAVLRSPVLSRADQARALAAVLDRLSINPIVKNLIGLMAKNRRLFVLERAITAYRERLARHRGEVAAEVISAIPLQPEHLQALRDLVKRVVGRDVTLDAKVDPALIGGLIVKVGSRMLDNSLRTKLQNLELALKGT
ncbi:MAG: F0F1 ATP synthase subunit delta [Alphaproteobacteria bacterium]|nr:F0F1 ATP synthase subunit delta [Alphaproteobacteria bacterium]